MKLWKVMVLLAFLPKFASAVVIHQVLYDPVTESGGEAVELYNPESIAVDIGGWAIATETSATDAIVPPNTTIAANSYFLLTDEGWDNAKDNSAWRSADYEEKITLTNTNAGIALIDSNGSIVDAVGWGAADSIEDGLYEATPAAHVQASKALLREQDTDDNSKDFVEAEPDFFGSNAITITVNVTGSNSSFEILEDDDPAPGIQLLPIAGETRHVQHSNGTFELPYDLAPGNYTFEGADYEVLPLEAYDIVKEKISLSASPGKKTTSQSSIILKNLGNIAINFGFDAADLSNGNKSISIDYLSLVVDDEEQGLEDVIVAAGEEKTVQFALFVPEGALLGTYQTMVYLTT